MNERHQYCEKCGEMTNHRTWAHDVPEEQRRKLEELRKVPDQGT